MIEDLKRFKIDFHKIEIVNFYNDVKWFFPKLKNNHLLSVPLTGGRKPPCVYFTKEVSRQSEIIDMSKIL